MGDVLESADGRAAVPAEEPVEAPVPAETPEPVPTADAPVAEAATAPTPADVATGLVALEPQAARRTATTAADMAIRTR
jgi:hypothetical protein